jgi:hypothetical protein
VAPTFLSADEHNSRRQVVTPDGSQTETGCFSGRYFTREGVNRRF